MRSASIPAPSASRPPAHWPVKNAVLSIPPCSLLKKWQKKAPGSAEAPQDAFILKNDTPPLARRQNCYVD